MYHKENFLKGIRRKEDKLEKPKLLKHRSFIKDSLSNRKPYRGIQDA
jgi:hypothetical protein